VKEKGGGDIPEDRSKSGAKGEKKRLKCPGFEKCEIPERRGKREKKKRRESIGEEGGERDVPSTGAGKERRKKKPFPRMIAMGEGRKPLIPRWGGRKKKKRFPKKKNCLFRKQDKSAFAREGGKKKKKGGKEDAASSCPSLVGEGGQGGEKKRGLSEQGKRGGRVYREKLCGGGKTMSTKGGNSPGQVTRGGEESYRLIPNKAPKKEEKREKKHPEFTQIGISVSLNSKRRGEKA